MGNEYGHGRSYQVDMDRGVLIKDHCGEVYHKYLDEQFWRNAQGQPLPAEHALNHTN